MQNHYSDHKQQYDGSQLQKNLRNMFAHLSKIF